MTSTARYEIFAALPWGKERDALPPVLVEHPAFSEVTGAQLRQARAPYRLRLDHSGGLHQLVEVPLRGAEATTVHLYHCDETGRLRSRTPIEIEPADYFYIGDYAVAADGACYLLERVRRGGAGALMENRLRKLDHTGAVVWMRTGAFSYDELDFDKLGGNFAQLLWDERGSLYLPGTEHAAQIARLNPDDGSTAEVYECPPLVGRVFLSGDRICGVTYAPETNRRGLGCFNPRTAQLEVTAGDDELFGWLLNLIGVDAATNFYVRRGATVAAINFGGEIVQTESFDNLVSPLNGDGIYTSRLSVQGSAPPVLDVTLHLSDGPEAEQTLSLTAAQGTAQDWKLIHVDARGRAFVYGGEAPGRTGTLLIYARDGSLEQALTAPADLLAIESALESFTYWQVDAGGRLYLPVTDPQGLKIVRLTLAAGRAARN